MEKVEFVADSGNVSRRVWIGRQLLQPEVVEPIQKRILRVSPEADLTRKSRLHLTWLSLGIPEELVANIQKFNHDLNPDKFLDDYKKTLQGMSSINAYGVVVPVEELAVFGHSDISFLVLRLRKTDELVEGREDFLNQILKLLKNHGISDPRDFLNQSISFRSQSPKQYNPHVTLGRVVQGKPVLPEVDVANLSLALSAPSLQNVTFSE